jgi:hypothetical protein
MAANFLRRRRRTPPSAPPVRPRPQSYFVVAGIPLDREMERLRALAVFAGGPLAAQEPELKVRRARARPNRLGFAVPTEFRLSVTAYPGIRQGDVLETLLHELVHLHVGRAAEAHAWHGRTFKATLARAMNEAYGIDGRPPGHTRHGVYAEAIERGLGRREPMPGPAPDHARALGSLKAQIELRAGML